MRFFLLKKLNYKNIPKYTYSIISIIKYFIYYTSTKIFQLELNLIYNWFKTFLWRNI